MKKIVLSFVLSISFIVSSAQDVLKISDINISLEEFKNVFYKNNYNTEVTKEYLDEYMNLFINFKLKVIEAKELGMDKDSSFIAELEGYRKQLAKPYLRNDEFDNQMLYESYNRIKIDVSASHILIRINEKNEKSAYNKALKIRKSIISNEISFSEAAKINSDDKSAVYNGGNLGYFTAFMMVYDFETAAYETKTGDISMPIRTKYGYHLIKVNDKRDAIGKVKVAHIMFKTGKGADDKKINKARSKIDNVTILLQAGENFDDLAERFSEDRSTAVKGGILPEFGVGKMVPEFEKIAFSLEKSGDISDPFLTDYGWHIIKLIEKNTIPNLEEIKLDLKKMIEKDSRGELSQQALYKKLRKSYNVKNIPSEYASFRKSSAVKVSKGIFTVKTKDETTLLSINNIQISINDFTNYILENQTLGSNIDQMYIDFVNQQLVSYEDSKLEEKHPEYKALLQEYKEGILLFNLTSEKVWLKAVEDTAGLKTFFNTNKDNYRWSKRVDATIYTCIDLNTAKKVKSKIYKKRRGKITDDKILEKTNITNPLSLQIESKRFEKGENKYVDTIDWELGISRDIVLKDGSYIMVVINEILDEKSKELNEIKGKVISDYQDHLESLWLNNLKSKYSIEINWIILQSLIK
jgi:peptidyl-prolyl cis-trans isomerase SurA